MKKLRLLVTKKCPRKCRGCCNKDWNLDKLETENDFSGYDEIMITGGEPLLQPEVVLEFIRKIRETNRKAKIILYTATLDTSKILCVLPNLDGITITLHIQKDANKFDMIGMATRLRWFSWGFNNHITIRLNIFKGVSVQSNLDWFIVKDNIEWIKKCPLPKDEVFKKYILF